MYDVHDNEIISYEVDLENLKITINTIRHPGSKNIEIVFYDALVHVFESQIRGSVIFDIEKYEVNQFLEANYEIMENQEDYRWPAYYKTVEELAEKLEKEQYAYYVISASYGLNGWVLAKKCEVLAIK